MNEDDYFSNILSAADDAVISEPLKTLIEESKLTVGTGRRHYSYVKDDMGNNLMLDNLTGARLGCGLYDLEYAYADDGILPNANRYNAMLIYRLVNYDVRFFRTREEARPFVTYLAKVQRGEMEIVSEEN